MKFKFFAVAAFACATIFASCSKDGGNEETNGGTQTILVSLPSGRAIEGQATAVASDITNLTVFLLRGTTVIGAPVEFDATDISAGKKRIEAVSGNVNNVLVVANNPLTGAALTSFKALTNANDIKKYAFTIASQNIAAAAGDEVKVKLLMDEAVPTTASDPDAATHVGHGYKVASIALEAITARIEVGAVKAGDNVANVELLGVWVNNYYTDGSKSTLKLHAYDDAVWNTTPAVTGNLGATAFTAPTVVPAYTVPSYYDAYNAAVDLTAASKAYAYHVFTGAKTHVILLVKGEYIVAPNPANPADKFFMGWVTITGFKDAGVTIAALEGNKIYKLGTGATGIVIDGDDPTNPTDGPETPITPDPELPSYDLSVAVTVTPWTLVNVTPEI